MLTGMQNRLARIQLTARRSPRQAIVRYEQLEKIANGHKQIAVQLDALYQRYFTMERLGEAEALLDTLQFGLHLAEENHLPRQAVRMLEALGRIHYTRGAYRESMNYWTTCIDIGNSIEDKNSGVEARIGLGQIYDALGDKENAKRFHQDAATLIGYINDQYLIAKLAINIGYNQFKTGDKDSAKQQFRHALDISQQGMIPEYEAEAYLHLGLIAVEEEDFPEAEKLTSQAIQVAIASNNSWAHSEGLKSLGHIYVSQHRGEQAGLIYKQALECAVKVGSKPQQLACLSALSHLSESHNDLRAALDYARKQMQLESTLSNELNGPDQLRLLQQYDLSHKSPIELLLDLSSSALLENQDIEQALQTISHAALTILNIDYMVIWLLDEPLNQLRCAVALVGDFAGIKKGMLFGGHYPTAQQRFFSGSHNERVIHNIRLHSNTAELMALFEHTDLRSILEITVRLHGKNTGLIYYGQAKTQRKWSHEDVLFGRKIGELVERILGDYSHRQNVQQLQEQNLLLEQRVSERTQQLEDAYRSIQQISLIDPLTGLHNRRFLNQQMDADVGLLMRRLENELKEYETAHRESGHAGPERKLKTAIVFFLVDLDHFKSINDTYGHASGDMVLVQMKQRLENTFRKSDYLVRWGGEEFLVVARDIRSDFAAATAERLCNTVADTPFNIVDHRSINVSCSVGFSDFPFFIQQPLSLTWLQVIDIADKAMYISKSRGRNTWVGLHGHAKSNQQNLLERIQKDVRQVIECGDLIMHTKLAVQE